MDNNCGIYKIENLVDGKMYIGSSTNLRKRLWNHKSGLKNNRHENRYLQRAYNKHGAKNFKFEVIIYCEEQDMLKREQEFLDFWWPTKLLYNINYEATDPPHFIKGVSCWSLDGEFVRRFDSMKEAAQLFGLSTGHLTDACDGRKRIAHGYFWSRDGESPKIRDKIYRGNCYPFKVVAVERNGKRMEFNNAKEAAIYYHMGSSSIRRLCCGKQNHREGIKFNYIKIRGNG